MVDSLFLRDLPALGGDRIRAASTGGGNLRPMTGHTQSLHGTLYLNWVRYYLWEVVGRHENACGDLALRPGARSQIDDPRARGGVSLRLPGVRELM